VKSDEDIMNVEIKLDFPINYIHIDFDVTVPKRYITYFIDMFGEKRFVKGEYYKQEAKEIMHNFLKSGRCSWIEETE